MVKGNMNSKIALLACALALVSLDAVGQVPVVLSPGVASDPIEAIGYVGDAGVQTGLGVYKKALTVPEGRSFRMTDLSLITRRANTNLQPCLAEIWRGTDTTPTSQVWSRIKFVSNETYDRSWQTAPTFAAGETVWVKAYFDPFNVGLRICMRTDPNVEAEIGYAIRGYLVRAHGH
jgi:hypothetical protein